MVDRIRYPTVSYLPFYYVFFQFLLLTIFNLQANILTTKDILSNLELEGVYRVGLGYRVGKEYVGREAEIREGSVQYKRGGCINRWGLELIKPNNLIKSVKFEIKRKILKEGVECQRKRRKWGR